MKKKKLAGCAVLAAVLAAALFVQPALAVPDWLLPQSASEAAEEQTQEPERDADVLLLSQDAGEHIQYMTGSGGRFYPEQPVTRAELAQMLDRIVADQPKTTPSFYDVPQDAWYTPAVLRIAGLELLTSSNGAFRPEEPATRAECAAALSAVLPYSVPADQTFPDVPQDHWAQTAIARTASYGLFQGDDRGYFRPEEGIRRCEAAAVFNRLLDRSPDATYLFYHPDLPRFPDVPDSHWAFADVMEASVTHQCTTWLGPEMWTSVQGEASRPQVSTPVQTPVPVQPPAPVQTPAPVQSASPALADGPQRIDGRLYWVSNGQFLRSQSVSGLYFDENGCYTTGNAELDVLLNDIVERQTNSSMTRDEKLRALFNYIRDNFRYLKRPLISKGQTGWEPDYALFFLKNGKGNCYSFSAAYCLLCRELGLPAYTVVGRALDSPHGWVEIVLDGSVYLFDTQLEWRYLHDWGKEGYNFFKMSPSNTPVKYTWL